MKHCCCCCCCDFASVVSDSVRPHKQQPTRLLCPWDSPGKNTGVGCHFPLQCVHASSVASVLSDSVLRYGQQPIRLHCPQDSLGKGTGWSGLPFPSPELHTKIWLNINNIVQKHWVIRLLIFTQFITMNFTFFSSAHGTFSRIDHILGHKSNLDKFKKIEMIPSIFSDHNALRLDHKDLDMTEQLNWTDRTKIY